MTPKPARVFTGTETTEVRLSALQSTHATFVGSPGMAGRYARMTFELGGHWFDVDGFVVSKWATTGDCVCQLLFSSMSTVPRSRAPTKIRPPGITPTAVCASIEQGAVPGCDGHATHIRLEARDRFEAALREWDA